MRAARRELRPRETDGPDAVAWRVYSLKSVGCRSTRSPGRSANACRHAASIRSRFRSHSDSFALSCTGVPAVQHVLQNRVPDMEADAPHHGFVGPEKATERAVAVKAWIERQHRC